MNTGVPPDSASVNKASTSTQDSAFLSLPLELRHQVYDDLFSPRDTSITRTLRCVTNLTGVNQQIRCEIYGLLAAVNTFNDTAGIFSNFTLKPWFIATRFSILRDHLEYHARFRSELSTGKGLREHAMRIKEFKDDIKYKGPPHQIKFWKVCVRVSDACGMKSVVVDINFREKRCVCRHVTAENGSHEFEKAFIDVMQEFTKEEGFDGVTMQDMSRFFAQVTMPNPKAYWNAACMFEELKEGQDY